MRPGIRWQTLLVILLLVGQVVFLAGVAHKNSTVADERMFYAYGHRILLEGSWSRAGDAHYNSKMPIEVVYAIPQFLGEKVKLWPFTLIAESVQTDPPLAPGYAYRFWARLASIVFYPLFSLILFIWARRLYGFWPALILLGLLLVSPNATAHSTIINIDAWTMCSFLAALFFCRNYVARPSFWRLILAGVFLGLALLVRNSAVLLAPIIIIAWFLERWPQTWDDLVAGRYRAMAGRGVKAVGVLFAWLVIALIVVNSGFGWQGFGASLNEVEVVSRPLRFLPGPILDLPLPLPFEFVNGLDQVIFDDQNAKTRALVYFMGHYAKLGSSAYYAVALLLKLPIGLLALAALAVWLRWRRKATPDDVWLVVPIVVVMLNMSFRTTTTMGIKYVLPVIPFLLLFLGRAFAYRPQKWLRPYHLGLVLLVGWIAVSSLASYPNYLGYMNEFVDPNIKYRYLNLWDLDVNQADGQAREWARGQEPPVPYSTKPKLGPIVVGGLSLMALRDAEDHYLLLRESYRPKANITGSHFLFEVDDLTPRLWRVVREARE